VRVRDPHLHIDIRAHYLFVRFILGMLIVLFFKCMAALFNPVNRRDGIKWGFVFYTVIMFSLATVYTATKAHILSICYIDNRNFPDDGPWGYHESMSYSAIFVISRAAFNLNNWSADGLLVSFFIRRSLVQVPNVGSSSSIVATYSTPRTSGSSPSPPSCISALLVRILVPHLRW